MNNEKNVPKIRFPGFTEPWEQRKLGEIYGSIGNAFVGTATPYYAEHGHFYLESNNVKDGQINHNAEIFINDEFYEKQKDKWLHTGDMVMVQSGHVGHAAVIPEELDNTAAHALIMFRNPKEEIEPYFLNYEYQTDKAKKQIENITTGNTIKHILASDMQEFVVDIPKYEEQKVIASYFCKLDHLITLHQRKLEHVKDLKKSMLQKMFPKNGQEYPELRFPGFAEPWEQRKVSELCSISTGKSNTQDKVEDGEYPFYVRSPIIERSTKYLYDEEAVITVGYGVGTGKVFHYVNGKYDLHQRCYRMYDFTDELNAHYFYHTFSKLFYKRVMAMTAKTSVDSVRLEMIADMEIPAPKIEEQVKIGTYFDNLDTLISLHQRELEHFKLLKKGMLQQMFV